MKFYSEYGEDRWCYDHIPSIQQFFYGGRRGVYADIGCGDPHQNNNTAFLRDSGWAGVAIDGNSHYQPHWGPEFECAVLAQNLRVNFEINAGNPTLSRVTDFFKADQTPTVPLENILTKRGVEQIDYLSIDIEGLEFEVMQTLNLDRHQPQVIVAEYATLQAGGSVLKDYRLLEYLLATGKYNVVHQTVANLIYVRK